MLFPVVEFNSVFPDVCQDSFPLFCFGLARSWDRLLLLLLFSPVSVSFTVLSTRP